MFCAREGGRGSPRRQEAGGISLLLKVPGGGGFTRTGEAEGPGGCLRRIGNFGGWRLIFFVRGRNVHQVFDPKVLQSGIEVNFLIWSVEF